MSTPLLNVWEYYSPRSGETGIASGTNQTTWRSEQLRCCVCQYIWGCIYPPSEGQVTCPSCGEFTPIWIVRKHRDISEVWFVRRNAFGLYKFRVE